MSDIQKALRQLPAHNLHDVIMEIWKVSMSAQEDEEQAVPHLQIHLTSGHCISGILIDYYREKKEDRTLLLQTAGHDISYIPFKHVTAVSIAGASAHIHHLSFGKFWYPPGAPAPTRLEVKRKMKEYQEKFQKCVSEEIIWKVMGKNIPDSGEALRVLLKGIHEAFTGLKRIVSDDAGKKIFTSKVKQVLFRHGELKGIEYKENDLTVTFNLDEEMEGIFTPYRLSEVIEESLHIQEVKWLEQSQEETLPKYQEQLDRECGFPLPCEIIWKDFEKDLEGLRNLEYQCLSRIVQALGEMCQEIVTRETLMESVTHIVIHNIADPEKKKIEIKDKTLCFFGAWGKSGYFSTQEIQTNLEQIL